MCKTKYRREGSSYWPENYKLKGSVVLKMARLFVYRKYYAYPLLCNRNSSRKMLKVFYKVNDWWSKSSWCKMNDLQFTPSNVNISKYGSTMMAWQLHDCWEFSGYLCYILQPLASCFNNNKFLQVIECLAVAFSNNSMNCKLPANI